MKLIILLSSLVLVSCGGSSGSGSSSPTLENSNTDITLDETAYNDTHFKTSSDEIIKLSIADSEQEYNAGLSFVQPEDFGEDEGKIFLYKVEEYRTFWMKNTFFDLDIFYLDKNFKVINVVRDLPYYEGSISSQIPRAPSIKSRHVLEMKSSSPIADSIHIGEQLTWVDP